LNGRKAVWRNARGSEKLRRRRAQEAQAFEAEQKKLQAAQEQAARDRRADLLSEQRKKLDEAVDKLATEPAERIAKVNKELETTKQRLEALREKDGSNAGAVDAALKQAEDIARRQIDAIEKPARDAATRVMEATARWSMICSVKCWDLPISVKPLSIRQWVVSRKMLATAEARTNAQTCGAAFR
jgi:exonuclease VII large subunit